MAYGFGRRYGFYCRMNQAELMKSQSLRWKIPGQFFGMPTDIVCQSFEL